MKAKRTTRRPTPTLPPPSDLLAAGVAYNVPTDVGPQIRALIKLHGYLIFLVGVVKHVALDATPQYPRGAIRFLLKVGAAFCAPADCHKPVLSYDRGWGTAGHRANGTDPSHPAFEITLQPGQTLDHAFRRALAENSIQWLATHRVPDRMIEKLCNRHPGTIRTRRLNGKFVTISYDQHEQQSSSAPSE